MKKLLCVLMFGMMFGQDAITTRDYTITINTGTELNIPNVTGYNLEGFYQFTLISYAVTIPSECNNINEWGESLFYYINIEGFYPINICVGAGFLNQVPHYISSQNPNLTITGSGTWGGVYEGSIDLTFWISGRFDDTDVGLNGDMNGDDSLDVLDVVMLVDVIINGGVGDVGDLINIVRG